VHRFGRFLVVGVVNTAVSYALYLGLTPLLGYSVAYVIAFAAGVATSYVLSSRWVFDSGGGALRAAAFPLVYVPQLLFGSLALRVAVERFGIDTRLALALVIGLTIPLNFLLARLILERRTVRAAQ
jgi:putative flippase GtrA